MKKKLHKVMANQRNTGKSTYELEKIKRIIDKKNRREALL